MNLNNPSWRPLFWDTDPASLNADDHAAYVLSRILERGTREQWQEACEYYGRERMVSILTRVRGLEPRSVSFCALVLGVPKDEFASATSRPA